MRRVNRGGKWVRREVGVGGWADGARDGQSGRDQKSGITGKFIVMFPTKSDTNWPV